MRIGVSLVLRGLLCSGIASLPTAEQAIRPSTVPLDSKHAEIASLREGIQVMQSRPPTDPAIWISQTHLRAVSNQLTSTGASYKATTSDVIASHETVIPQVALSLRPLPKKHDPVERPRPAVSPPQAILAKPAKVPSKATIGRPTIALPFRPKKTKGPNTLLIKRDIALPSPSPGDGWETNVADAGSALFFTSNYLNWFSKDFGNTWTAVDPYTFMSDVPGGFCCDQVVQYIPAIYRFVWLAQSNVDPSNENEYRLASASPSELVASSGAKWRYWDLKAHDLAGAGHSFDYPEIAYDQNYLFLCFNDNSTGSGQAMLARVPLAALDGRAAFRVDKVVVTAFWPRPVQNTNGRGLFAWQETFGKTTTYFWPRIAVWDDGGPGIDVKDVSTSFVVSTDWKTSTPEGNDWLAPVTKVDWHFYGATQVGNTIVLSWNMGRFPLVLPYPHIEIALVDASSFEFNHMELIWSQQYAYVWPALATSTYNDVGISLEYGGPTTEVAYGVGLRGGDYSWQVQGATPPPGAGGGGHFLGVRPIPDSSCFAGAGYVSVLDPSNQPAGNANHPYYVEFTRKPAQGCP